MLGSEQVARTSAFEVRGSDLVVRSENANLTASLGAGSKRRERAADLKCGGLRHLLPSKRCAITILLLGMYPGYRPTTRTVNEPGTMLGRGRGWSGVGAGGGPNSAVTR
jgi:hypothetical protein